MELVDPVSLVAEVERDVSKSKNVLDVYWVQTRGDRSAYAMSIRAAAKAFPIVPIVIRQHGFDDPNSVLQDLMEVVNSERLVFDEPSFRALAREHGKIAIILIARVELAIPQVQSPVLLPDWFPVNPSEQVVAYLKDMTWSVDVPLKSLETKSSHVARLLYELEGAIQARLKSQLTTNHNSVSSLLDKLRGGQSKESFADILQTATSYRDKVSDPEAFRPSRKEGKCFTVRLWDFYMKNGPEQLQQYAKALADALQPEMESKSPVIPLQAVIYRPSARITEVRVQWALSLIISIGAACQFLTATAHSDQYQRYPSLVLRAFSLDIRKFLQDAVDILKN
jgi:hypothetical protein